jgi:hypothetical protein
VTIKDTRLREFQRALQDATENLAADIAAAQGNAELIQKIQANYWKHHANWSMAATAALEKNNDRIQALFDDAKAANKAIKEARKKAEDIATIVRSSSNVATALTQLLENVAKA